MKKIDKRYYFVNVSYTKRNTFNKNLHRISLIIVQGKFACVDDLNQDNISYSCLS